MGHNRCVAPIGPQRSPPRRHTWRPGGCQHRRRASRAARGSPPHAEDCGDGDGAGDGRSKASVAGVSMRERRPRQRRVEEREGVLHRERGNHSEDREGGLRAKLRNARETRGRPQASARRPRQRQRARRGAVALLGTPPQGRMGTTTAGGAVGAGSGGCTLGGASRAGGNGSARSRPCRACATNPGRRPAPPPAEPAEHAEPWGAAAHRGESTPGAWVCAIARPRRARPPRTPATRRTDRQTALPRSARGNGCASWSRRRTRVTARR